MAHLLRKNGHLARRNGHLVRYVAPCAPCCGGGYTPGADCTGCTNPTTPLHYDGTLAGFGCCYGGALNATWRMTQNTFVPCQWTYFDGVVAGGFNLELKRNISDWTLTLQLFASGDSYIWTEPNAADDCATPPAFPARIQPPSFGPCNPCANTTSATVVPAG